MGLRPYQQSCITSIREGWMDGIQSQLACMATGLGKTPVMAYMAKEEIDRGGRVLVLAHTDELIEQAIQKITRFCAIPVRKEKAGDYAGRRAKCVVGSVQTLQGDLRLSMWPANFFTLVLIDEAHRAASASYVKIINKFKSGGAKIVGVTATADRGDKKSLKDIFDRIAYDYNLLHGVRDGWLIRPIVKTIPLSIDLNDVNTRRTKEGSDLNQSQVAQKLVPFLDAIAKQSIEANPRGVFMFFLPSVETARLMADALTRTGAPAEWISGDRPERKAIVADFKRGRYKAICNMAVLTEGFDYDRVDTIVCLRPTKIRSLFVQIVGRACRPLDNIVGLLNDAPNALDRLSIIKHSAKPHYLILDFLWLYDKHKDDLVKPAALVSNDEKVQREMAGKEGDLVDIEEKAERDVLAKLESAVRQNSNKKSKVIDPLAIAIASNDVQLAEYEPETENDGLAPTDLQLKRLETNGVDISKVIYRGHATKLLLTIADRYQKGLSTFRQMNFFAKIGVDASGMTRDEARTKQQEYLDKWDAERIALRKAREKYPEIVEVDI